MRSTDVAATMRDMWDTRPARPRDDRMVAGVAAGIARRYDIDPVLVRVGFVVAALSGIGAVLYLAGWFALPDTPPDPAAPTSKRRPILVVAVVVAAAIGIGSIFDGGGRFLLPLLAVAALLFLLHLNRGSRAPVGPPAAAPPAPEPATSGLSMVKEPAPAAEPVVPPSWDPLGAAPFAWDLPEPSPVPPPPPVPPRRRLPVTSVTLGLALLAAGITTAILLLTGTFSATTVPTVLGVLLAAIGTGLVVGSFLHAGRGLIPFALVLSLLTWGVLAAPLDRLQADGFGDLDVRPATLADLQPSYTRGAGDLKLDLRALDLTAVADTSAPAKHVAVDSGAGSVEVWLPPNADVQFTGSAGLGDVEIPGREKTSGPGARITVTDLGADGVRAGQLIEIDAHVGAGDVEMHRG